MAWTVEFDEAALRELRKIDGPAQVRIMRYLRERIATDAEPRRLGKALQGNFAGLWRYRVGDYRVICQIKDECLTVLVLAIKHRSIAYDT